MLFLQTFSQALFRKEDAPFAKLLHSRPHWFIDFWWSCLSGPGCVHLLTLGPLVRPDAVCLLPWRMLSDEPAQPSPRPRGPSVSPTPAPQPPPAPLGLPATKMGARGERADGTQGLAGISQLWGPIQCVGSPGPPPRT